MYIIMKYVMFTSTQPILSGIDSDALWRSVLHLLSSTAWRKPALCLSGVKNMTINILPPTDLTLGAGPWLCSGQDDFWGTVCFLFQQSCNLVQHFPPVYRSHPLVAQCHLLMAFHRICKETFPVFISQDLESQTEDLSMSLQLRLISPECFCREAQNRGKFLNLFSDFITLSI